uniref:Uncharacterized protein n=1 Tax=Chromera velia CCMP2878 TaxID=1169474 RepID=A0A0G4F3I2_9ALVE|eukprot:Cvel_14918.t1-p1 / transcript=Cvel_14918.t1 / gene=Cvel_14918 / organism=Chromera_velia_CCMP2878 / gene_product=hypothetical protein / transcript_product=hypothetical protein / location=Cvel_scaffold1081:8678-9115(+) / protein_length=146 / sequence_SO=supercontig / SO=protein_coding / is_pseudo=false
MVFQTHLDRIKLRVKPPVTFGMHFPKNSGNAGKRGGETHTDEPVSKVERTEKPKPEEKKKVKADDFAEFAEISLQKVVKAFKASHIVAFRIFDDAKDREKPKLLETDLKVLTIADWKEGDPSSYRNGTYECRVRVSSLLKEGRQAV